MKNNKEQQRRIKNNKEQQRTARQDEEQEITTKNSKEQLRPTKNREQQGTTKKQRRTTKNNREHVEERGSQEVTPLSGVRPPRAITSSLYRNGNLKRTRCPSSSDISGKDTSVTDPDHSGRRGLCSS